MTEQVIIKVSMADLRVLHGIGMLKTTGLGSCVGVSLYDDYMKVAGMAHVMLPSSDIAREGNMNIAKYADTAIPELIKQMVQLGASKGRIKAKLVGGSQMFAFTNGNDAMRIGPRNVESSKVILHTHGIPILAEDTGGNYGRTIELDSSTGTLQVRSVQHGTKEL